MTALSRVTRLAWAGFVGGTVLGFSYLLLIDPVGSRTTDSVIVLGVVAVGTTFGVWLATRVERLQTSRRPAVPSQELERSPTEALAGR
jgi:hypothetical protein